MGIRVTIDGDDEYVIYWAYNRKAQVKLRELDEYPVTRATTQCTVEKIGAGDPPDRALAAVGTAICKPGDNFNREEGRRQSLTRAIADFPKGIRRQFWEAYFARGPIHFSLPATLDRTGNLLVFAKWPFPAGPVTLIPTIL